MANDPMLEMFIFENVQLTERLEEVLIEGEQQGGFNSEHINEIFRIMHTIKGSAAMMEYNQISTLAHKIEDMFFYIREHDEAKPNWSEIADICLGAVDFFKQEVAKIQAGNPSDGNMDASLKRIEAVMEGMNVTPDKKQKATESKPSVPEVSEAAEQASASDDEGVYIAKINFEDGCKMENIRAYQIVNSLMNFCDRIDTVPEDLLDDCSDEIIANGVKMTIYSHAPVEKLRSVVSEALFLQKFDLTKASSDVPAVQTPDQTVISHEPEKPAEQPREVKVTEHHIEQAEEPKHVQAQAELLGIQKQTLEAAAPTEIKQSFISVNVDKLDKLMDLMGEIVISVAMVVSNPDLEGLQLDNFEKASSQLLKNTGELQNIIMSVRMLPISSTFHKMSRIVRDTAKKLNKEVELSILGEETEVDKNIIDNLSDPLMHIIRNSMDHGIENSRDDRIASGKPPIGHIVLEARNSGSDVIISCTDDGLGLDKDKIMDKAKRANLLTKPEYEYSEKEIYQFIMLPGFSTNEQVTELSGRGVGMDVVKRNIEKVGGTVVLDSTPGQGMTVSIRIPLTLAILQSIEISVGKNIYLIPTLNIRESYKPDLDDIIIDPDGNEMIMYRGECYSIVRLHQIFGVETEVTEFQDGIIIMVEDDGNMTAVFADLMVGEQQAVVKPIPSFITERIGQIYGISGCTLLGDGSISLIIDVKSLTQ